MHMVGRRQQTSLSIIVVVCYVIVVSVRCYVIVVVCSVIVVVTSWSGLPWFFMRWSGRSVWMFLLLPVYVRLLSLSICLHACLSVYNVRICLLVWSGPRFVSW